MSDPSNSSNNSDNDDVWDTEADDATIERRVAEQSLGKLSRAFENSGYKYGLEASKMDYMQRGFDAGFSVTYSKGRLVGHALGALLARRAIQKKQNKGADGGTSVDSVVMRLRSVSHTSLVDPVFLKDAAAVGGNADVGMRVEVEALVSEANGMLIAE